jgi:hypothetical protein
MNDFLRIIEATKEECFTIDIRGKIEKYFYNTVREKKNKQQKMFSQSEKKKKKEISQ